MTITLNFRPEVEGALAREVYAAALLDDAAHLSSSEGPDGSDRGFGKKLVEVCARVRGVLTDEETNTLFSREPSTDRPLDLS